MFKCSECGNSLNRYSFETLKKGFRIWGGFYTHTCPVCKLPYAPSTIALLCILALISYIDFPELPAIINNWWSLVALIPITSIGFFLYVVPLSVFIKKDSKVN